MAKSKNAEKNSAKSPKSIKYVINGEEFEADVISITSDERYLIEHTNGEKYIVDELTKEQ